jgi:type I restriction enzyme, S subunit
VRSSTFRFSSEHLLYGRLRPYLNKVLAPDFDGHRSTEVGSGGVFAYWP